MKNDAKIKFKGLFYRAEPVNGTLKSFPRYFICVGNFRWLKYAAGKGMARQSFHMKPLDAFQSPKSQNSLVYESAFFNLFWEDVSRWLSVTFRLFPSPFSLLQRPSRPLKAEFSVFSSNGFDTCKNTCTMLRGEDTQELGAFISTGRRL